jgi:hypothetical protein
MKNYFVLVLIFVFAACSKDSSEKDNRDNELPVVTISSPDNNQVFNAGATVIISGSVTDNKEIAEVHVHISNNTTGQLLKDIHRYPATGSYPLNESFQTQSGVNYKIQVIAKDDSANENRATVEVSAN